MKKARPVAISKPVTITMRPVYRKKADEIMAHTGEKISQLTRRLLHEEWERLKAGRVLAPERPAPRDESKQTLRSGHGRRS